MFCFASHTRTEGLLGHFTFACALATLAYTTRLHYPSRARYEPGPLIFPNFRSPSYFEESKDYPRLAVVTRISPRIGLLTLRVGARSW